MYEEVKNGSPQEWNKEREIISISNIQIKTHHLLPEGVLFSNMKFARASILDLTASRTVSTKPYCAIHPAYEILL